MSGSMFLFIFAVLVLAYLWATLDDTHIIP